MRVPSSPPRSAFDTGAISYYESEIGEDFYHCYFCQNSVGTCRGCVDVDFRTFRGSLGVSHSSLFNSADQTTYLKFSHMYTYTTILETELAAIKALWTENCLPWLAPDGWDWDESLPPET